MNPQKPGEHTWTTTRQNNTTMRDTILVLMPGPQIKTYYLIRNNLDGTIAENTLKHGCGGLWIDKCRIASNGEHLQPPSKRTSRTSFFGKQKKPFTCTNSPLGRWPTNLILVHGPNCKKIDTTQTNRWTNGTKPFGNDTGHKYAQTTLDTWECQPDCPARILSKQSGITQSKPHDGDGQNMDTRSAGWGFRRMPSALNDIGTATRFFPQFANLDDALAWMQQLIARPSP